VSENDKNTTPEDGVETTEAEATEAEATETDAPETEAAAADEASTDEAAADAEADVAPSDDPPEEAAPPEESPGMTVSHAIGVSRPEDKYVSPGSDDNRTREELEKLGVEPDTGGIDPVLLASLVGVVVLTVAAWIFSTQLFEFAGKQQIEMNANQANYPMLAEVRDTARAQLNGFAELEGDDDGLYRVPIEVAFDVLVENTDLLAAHPAGAPVERELPEGLAAPTLRTPPSIPSEARPAIQLGTPTDRIELDLGIQGSAGTQNRIGRVDSAGNVLPTTGATTIQVEGGGVVEVEGTPTAAGTEPVVVEGAGVDTAGNPDNGTNAPPADDPTANTAGSDDTNE